MSYSADRLRQTMHYRGAWRSITHTSDKSAREYVRQINAGVYLPEQLEGHRFEARLTWRTKGNRRNVYARYLGPPGSVDPEPRVLPGVTPPAPPICGHGGKATDYCHECAQDRRLPPCEWNRGRPCDCEID